MAKEGEGGIGGMYDEDNIITIGITYDTKTGNVGVKCKQMGDKVLMYGILEATKYAIIIAKPASPIVKPRR